MGCREGHRIHFPLRRARHHCQPHDMAWEDLPRMTFLTRLITETLRFWPSVPNGTFRELQSDETLRGRDGKMVTLKKGTNLWIGQWALHLNPALWGEDAHLFNP